MDNIMEMLESGKADIKFVLNGEDLKTFAESLLKMGAEQAKEDLEKQEQFLSKREVMKLFGVCDTTLWHWQKSGFLIPRKIGRKILYSKPEVEKCLASR